MSLEKRVSLQNLARIGQLVEHETDRVQVGKLMEAAARCIDDARVESISTETRFDAAYKAAMQFAMLALWANGYRPAKNKPGLPKIFSKRVSPKTRAPSSTRPPLNTARKIQIGYS